MERHGPVDWQYAPHPVLPAPPRAGSTGRARRTLPARTASALLCGAGVLLVAASAVMVHLAPPAATAVPVALPAPAPAAGSTLSGSALPGGTLPGPPPSTLLPPPPAPTAAPAKKARSRPVVDAEAAPPRSVKIKAAGIDSRLVNLRRQRDGALEVPSDYALAGWYRDGVKPGDRGPAVLVGHVDSYEGPAVFYRLQELRKGDRVVVTRTDGSTVEFAVYARETVQKDEFPTSRVYGDTDRPELRLLTCGGPFDSEAKHYRDNVVVYAELVDD